MRRKCELCNNEAKIYCGSDKAILCYECDSRVHGANFLVAKHIRTLLCRVCQSPTHWTGSGPKLASNVSVCQTCLSATRHVNGAYHGHVDHYEHDHNNNDDDDNEDHSEEEEDEDEDEDEDNQVVPWSYNMSQPRSVTR